MPKFFSPIPPSSPLAQVVAVQPAPTSLPLSSEHAEALVREGVSWLRLAVEVTGAAIIVLGIIVGVVLFVRSLLTGQTQDFNRIRLTLARYLALALEFQLGADLLSTAIAPDWGAIGRLASIAVIRTGLNYFLSREMQEEREGAGPDAAVRDLAQSSREQGHATLPTDVT